MIGREGEPLRGLAFDGGGFDSLVQLGVAHAFLVTGAKAPDIVAGISTGAVNAVAFAEILQAGNPYAQMAKFREVLEAYRRAPEELWRGLAPDPHEINLCAPLEQQDLPIHFQAERDERNRYVAARFGLIRLLNDLLALRLRVSSATKLIRLGLEVRRRKFLVKAYNGVKLLLNLIRPSLAQPVLLFITNSLFAGPYQTLLRRLKTAHETQKLPWYKEGWESLKTGFLQLLLRASGFYQSAPVKEIISFSLWRWIRRVMWRLSVWATVAAPWLCIYLGLYFAAYKLFGWPWLNRIPVWVDYTAIYVAAFGGFHWILALVAVVSAMFWPKYGSFLIRRFLSGYDLNKDLTTPYLVKSLYVKLFDPGYWGTIDLDDVVANAFRGNRSANSPRAPKTLECYWRTERPVSPIYVAPMAANLANGDVDDLPQSTPVVNALMAATAFVPLFRAQAIGEKQYIDAISVSNGPTLALLDLLRKLKSNGLIHNQISGIELYPISAFPVIDDQQPEGQPGLRSRKSYSGLVDVVVRALKLKKVQNASIEKWIVQSFSDVLPRESKFVFYGKKLFINARRESISTDHVLNVNERMLKAANRDKRREIADEAVAEGCLATMNVLVKMWGGGRPAWGHGVAEICKRCKVLRARNRRAAAANSGAGHPSNCPYLGSTRNEAEAPEASRGVGAESSVSIEAEASTVSIKADLKGKHSNVSIEAKNSVMSIKAESSARSNLADVSDQKWLKPRETGEGTDRPTVTFLFSGGVFRGVFQIGIANALNMAGGLPDLIAGTSVGAVTGALIAEVFSIPNPDDRADKLRQLASVFLCVDRLILTDRFSDFVRQFTLHAAAANFSLRDLDLLTRRYSKGSLEAFGKRARRVISGVQGLLYMTPKDQEEFLGALIKEDWGKVNPLLIGHLRNFLDHSGVALEGLGAEPLELLIDNFVESAKGSAANFDWLREQGIYLLAPTTNVGMGSSEKLVSRGRKVGLREGLLASSAFPGVFRPRWNWEIFGSDGDCDKDAAKFFDGGMMDNLPVRAVVKFLEDAVTAGWVVRDPHVVLCGGKKEPVPHLILTGSLEEIQRPLRKPDAAQAIAESWLDAWPRAIKLRYNRKIDLFCEAGENLQLIKDCRDEDERKKKWPLVNVQTIVVKPEWLCGTFAFNSMLGFKLAKQAASIAHGCASTLAALHRNGATKWGFKDFFDPKCDHGKETALVPVSHGESRCWFCQETYCPFSPARLKLQGLEIDKATRKALAEIYKQCGNKRTHSGW